MAKSKSSKQNSLIDINIDYEHINIISMIINGIILIYIIKLEHNNCNCIRDWRHNYIKYPAMFSLFINYLIFFNIAIINFKSIISIIIFIYSYYIYAFYTYIRDLDNTKCKCAVVKQEKLHKFLNIWRYIFPIITLFIIIYFLYNIKK